MCAALYGLGKEARPACFFRARSQGGLFSNRREGITIKKRRKKRERETQLQKEKPSKRAGNGKWPTRTKGGGEANSGQEEEVIKHAIF